MACEVLIAAEDKNHSLKGYPKNVKDVPCVWGKKEGPPGYVILRITDATAAQVEHYLKQWHKQFTYEILAENKQGYRIKVTVDPALVSASGLNKEIRADLKNYIVESYGAQVHRYDLYEAVIDIPKPLTINGDPTTLQGLRDDVHDKFSEMVDSRFYYFSESDVDYALSQPGGIVERTKAQVVAMINSKLDD